MDLSPAATAAAIIAESDLSKAVKLVASVDDWQALHDELHRHEQEAVVRRAELNLVLRQIRNAYNIRSTLELTQ